MDRIHLKPARDVRRGLSAPIKQRGQSILLILLVTVVGILLALSMVNIGILTGEKIELQNAADATAYSVSTIEARDLNFAAYTNRAMVANEVALGQMVGMASWAKMTNSTPAFLGLYFKPILAIPIIGQFIEPMISGILKGIRAVTTVIDKGVAAFAKIVSKPLNYINQAYSVAQRGMHMGSLVFSLSTMADTISGNAEDAQLSVFGILAILRHYQTYFSDFNFEGDPFISSFRAHKGWDLIPQLGDKPEEDAQKEGMTRFAAMVNEARDPFSKNRYCSVGFICNDEDTGGWSLPFVPPLPPPFEIPWEFELMIPNTDICFICFYFSFAITMDRAGGSDVRYIEKGDEQRYSWTAVDTLAMNVDLKLYSEVFGFDPPSVDVRGGAPLGTGGAQIAKKSGKYKSGVDYGMMSDEVSENGYGMSPEINPGNWLWNPRVSIGGLDGPYSAVNTNFIDTSNRGLPRYNDSKTGPDPIVVDKNLKLGFESPYLLIGLVKKMNNVSQSSARGRFALESGVATDDLAVLGKSEVYFARPNSLSYFARDDGATELGNTFNPYWQARLVDTSYIDRTAALAIQQGQLWLPSEVDVNLDHMKSVFNFIQGFF
ncbi:MAG: hypothetical protein GY696_28850 [Gammaproteobacteria bacterium]|nr:hypothetical protein [Gammaproteobacteria bacterium]